MEEIIGHHGIWTWIGVLFCGFWIQFTYKLHLAPNKKNGFKWRYFWNDNTLDFIKNAVLSFAILRLGDSAIHQLFGWIKKQIPNFPLDGEGMDIVITVSLLSVVLSAVLHKYVKVPIRKTIKDEMHVHNENCNH